jgi:hypothetical protein
LQGSWITLIILQAFAVDVDVDADVDVDVNGNSDVDVPLAPVEKTLEIAIATKVMT